MRVSRNPFEYPVAAALRGLLAASLLLFLLASEVHAAAESSGEFFKAWLVHQEEVRTWSADVVQIRKLKSLVRPLKSRGQVWFEQPNRFRWQLGNPPRTIALRNQDELLIIYPRLKQAERYSTGEDVDPAWKQVLALLEVGFPSSEEAFFAQYELRSTLRTKKAWKFELRPAADAARRLLDRVWVEVSRRDYSLMATELVFPDGSTMRNEFIHRRLNPELEEGLFDFPIDEGYQVVSPLEGNGPKRPEDRTKTPPLKPDS